MAIRNAKYLKCGWFESASNTINRGFLSSYHLFYLYPNEDATPVLCANNREDYYKETDEDMVMTSMMSNKLNKKRK